MKAEDWISDALLEIGVGAAEQPVQPSHMQTGIRYGNRLMFAHDFLGLGYTVVSSANDTVTIPPFAEDWAVKALALSMSKQFGPNDNEAALRADVTKSYKLMLKHIPLDISMNMPEILPVGSGNECYASGVFYPGDENVILDEQGQYILLEDNT